MPLPELFQVFTSRLNRLGIRHMVTGSVAATFYGEPRLTNDVDIVVELRQEDAPAIAAAFPADDFYCPPSQIIEAERKRPARGHFNLIDHATGYKADIYLSGDDPLHAEALTLATAGQVGGEEVWFAPPEYVIVRKLQFYREGQSPKHLRDVHRMLMVLGEKCDRSRLEDWIGRLGMNEEWQAAQVFSE